MRSCHCVPFALASFFLQVPAAFALGSGEEDLAMAYGDEATVSIATGSRQAIRRAPAVTTVITAEDIAAMGATDLDQILETVPGIHVSRIAVAYAPVYVVRGITNGGPSNPQVLILRDGVPLTSMYSGDMGNARGITPVENIARIEVIRGPGSALYGADAYAGVINIITKAPDSIPGTQAGLRVESFDTRSTWVLHGGMLGEIDVAAFLRVGSSDGFKRTVKADAQTQIDRQFGTSASLAPGAVSTGYDAVDGSVTFEYGKWRLRAAYILRDELGTGAGVSSALDPTSTVRSERILSDLSWTAPRLANSWGAGFTASFVHYSEKTPDGLVLLPSGLTLPTGVFPDGMIGGPNRWERQLRLSSFVTYAGFADHNLRFGVGHDDLDLYKTATYKNFLLNPAGVPIPTGPVIDYSDIQPHILPQRRRVTYLYGQDEWHVAPDWTLTAGLRHDHYSDFGGTTNPRVALVWDAALDVTAKLLYGRAFRAPAFNEQYGLNPVANGNPNLRPEIIDTLEAALSWQANRSTEINLNLFKYRMKDIIRAVPNPIVGTGSTFDNVGSQHGHGLELDVAWHAGPDLRLSGNFAYQRSIDEATDRDAGYAPRRQIYARADWYPANGWTVSPQLTWLADRQRAANDARAPIPDYTTVDLTVRTRAANARWDFTASIRNMFDADVREPSPAPGLAIPDDLPMAPRSLYVQAVYHMN